MFSIFLHGFMTSHATNKQTKMMKKQIKSNEKIANKKIFYDNINQLADRKASSNKDRNKYNMEQSDFSDRRKEIDETRETLIIELVKQGKSLQDATQEIDNTFYYPELDKFYCEGTEIEEEMQFEQEANEANKKVDRKVLAVVSVCLLILLIVTCICR